MGASGLPDRLAALAREGAGAGNFEVRALDAYRLSAVACDGPLLVLPVEGTKWAHLGAGHWQAGAGEMLMVHWPVRVDIENIPDPRTGTYLALVLTFPPETLAAARALARLSVGVPGEPISMRVSGHVSDATVADCRNTGPASPVTVMAVGEVAAPLFDWLEAPAGQAPALRALAAVRLLLALREFGHGGWAAPRGESVAERVHRLIAAEPGKRWDSAALEALLGMSGATLRRRLAESGTSLRAVQLEARMRHALGLLQTTRLPVKAVAARCGYASVAGFSKRFEARYGVEPSRVANG